MRVTYQPDDPQDGDRQTWTFKPGRVRVTESEVIAKAFGGTFEDWNQALLTRNGLARRVLLWHLLRLAHPMLRFTDTPDFMMDELEVELDRGELTELLDNLPKLPMDEKTRQEGREAIEAQIAELDDEEPVGKAPANEPTDIG